jgi:cytochrome d ubiquinol oxidase subunit I
MVLAAFITTCFVIGGVSAGYLRRGVHVDAGRRMLKLAVVFAAIAVPTQIFVGDLHGLNVGKHQPTKLAAMEAHWEQGAKGEGVPLILFALPNQEQERNDYEIAVPKLGSVILTHSLDGEVQPLKAVPADERPPVAPVFFAFRVMVGLGLLMLALVLLSVWQWRHGKLFTSALVLNGWRAMTLAGFVAILSGWYVVEIGRQPYVVYGLLRTAEAVTPTLAAGSVMTSLLVFAAVYFTVFGAGIWYLLKLIRKGPQPHEPMPESDSGERTPARPLSIGNRTPDDATPETSP